MFYKDKIKKWSIVKMDYDFILIGLTSGGPKALYQIIDKFDQSLQTPIIIIQNLPVGFDKIFCQVFQEKAKLPIQIIEEEMKLENKIFLAKSGYILSITKDKIVKLISYPYPKACISYFIKLAIKEKLKFITICLAGNIIKDDPIEGLKILKDLGYPILVQRIGDNPNLLLKYETSLPEKVIKENLFTEQSCLEKIPELLKKHIFPKGD